MSAAERPLSDSRLRFLASRSAFALSALIALSAAIHASASDQPNMRSSDADKIVEASRSAPGGLTADATFLDWPAEAGGDFRVIREGANGWNCLPDYPLDTSYAPECFDDEWRAFLTAYLRGDQPSTRRIGLSYMLNARWAVSNTDRMATEPTPDNQWHEGGSHIMLVVPDPAMLAWFPTEPTPKGGAYVMFAGTPYAHLMIPIPEAHAGDR